MNEISNEIKTLFRYKALFELLHKLGYEFYNPSCMNVTFIGYSYKYILPVAHMELQRAKTWLADNFRLDVAVSRKGSGYHGFEIWYFLGDSKGWSRKGSFLSEYNEPDALIEGMETAMKWIKDNNYKPFPNESTDF